MISREPFAVFILTHGRPQKVITLRTLRAQGYTGPVYIVIDNEDETANDYLALYGDSVVVFDKAQVAKEFDTADNFTERRSVVFARNACFSIARDKGVEYFLQLDDDYEYFLYKFAPDFSFRERRVKNLDALFSILLEYYKSSGALTLAMAQNGDFIGGAQATNAKSVKIMRKCMNTFFCTTARPFKFVGRVNEDVCTYTSLGNRGQLLLTVNAVSIKQKNTQTNSGGMTELYKKEGTYIKSFYPVLFCPSFVKIGMMGKRRRLHHRIEWRNAVPCIVSSKWRKPPS